MIFTINRTNGSKNRGGSYDVVPENGMGRDRSGRVVPKDETYGP